MPIDETHVAQAAITLPVPNYADTDSEVEIAKRKDAWHVYQNTSRGIASEADLGLSPGNLYVPCLAVVSGELTLAQWTAAVAAAKAVIGDTCAISQRFAWLPTQVASDIAEYRAVATLEVVTDHGRLKGQPAIIRCGNAYSQLLLIEADHDVDDATIEAAATAASEAAGVTMTLTPVGGVWIRPSDTILSSRLSLHVRHDPQEESAEEPAGE